MPIDTSKLDLDKMTADELTDISSAMTKEKDEYLGEYAVRQQKIHVKIDSKQKSERAARLSNPDYAAKSQSVG